MPFAGHAKDAEGLSYIDVMNPFAFVSMISAGGDNDKHCVALGYRSAGNLACVQP
jgi:hypothetical protein